MIEEDVAFHQRLGHLIENAEREDFWPIFAAFLREYVSFDSWVVLVFREFHSPLLVHEGDADKFKDDLFGNYLRTFYVNDPFYRFAMGSFSAGIWRLDEVAGASFQGSDYFHDYFRLNVVEDELQLLTPFGAAPNARAVLSLSVGSRRRFPARACGLLGIMSPWIQPLLRMAARHTLDGVLMPTGTSGGDNLERRLRSFNEPRLTDREIQTALLILSGQSTKGIAAHLGISPETAKVHRRNLYEKLGVNSQADLFLRYLG